MYPKVFMLLVIFSRTYFVQSAVCDKEDSVDISKGTHLSNGDIFYDGTRYQRTEYYTDNETGIERACFCAKKTCVKKCCPMGYGYHVNKKICINVSDVFDPPVWSNYRMIKNIKAKERFHFKYGKVNCTSPSEVRIRISAVSPSYHLKMDGKLYIELPNKIPPWTVQSPDKYCIDTFVYEDPSGVKSTQLDALACFTDEREDHHYVLSSTCMIISCVFILATVGVYMWLPELRNLHGRVLMAYLLCLFVAFAFLATMQILLTINNITLNNCLGMTFVIYYSLLAAFFWLNVMCFDIWWTFSGKRGLSLEKLSCRARFYAYSLYAFGIPTALTILMAALEFSGLPSHPLLPLLRHQGCFIYGNSKLLYLYGPIVILCLANMIFFILTAVKIAKINQQTSVLKSKESATHDQHRNDKQRLLLYVKLFAVMGVNWLLEVVSAIYPEADDFWMITDAYNVLIGFIIFVIFVCKRKIFRLMKKRYKQLRGEPMSRSQTTTSRTLSSKDEIKMNSVKSNSAPNVN